MTGSRLLLGVLGLHFGAENPETQITVEKFAPEKHSNKIARCISLFWLELSSLTCPSPDESKLSCVVLVGFIDGTV